MFTSASHDEARTPQQDKGVRSLSTRREVASEVCFEVCRRHVRAHRGSSSWDSRKVEPLWGNQLVLHRGSNYRESRELNPYGEPLREQASGIFDVHVCNEGTVFVIGQRPPDDGLLTEADPL